MKHRYSGILFWLIILLLISCKKDNERLSVRLQLIYGQEPMVMQKEYPYPDGNIFIPTKVSMYLSELSIGSNDQTQPISDVSFIDFSQSHKTAELATEGFLLYQDESGLEAIANLRFNVGLTADQNKTVPSDYPSGHPMAMPGEYWLAWNSYIFFKIEGRIDLDGDGVAEEGVALHLGSDQVMRSFQLQNLMSGPEVTVQIDVAKIFGTDKIYDIGANPQIHSLSQLPALLELANNLEHSITLKSHL